MVVTVSDPLSFVDNVTDLDQAELNMLVQMARMNLTRNAHFGSWTSGPWLTPDCWYFPGYGGVISRESTIVKSGKYSVKIAKTSSDANHDWLYFDIGNAMQGHIKSRSVTIVALIKTNRSNSCRIIANTNTGTFYGSYNGGTSWEKIAVTINLDEAVTFVTFAIECQKPMLATGTFYIDCVFAYIGKVAPVIDTSPLDYHPVISGRENDGTFEHDAGGYRIIPFEKTWSAAGGTLTDSVVFAYTNANPDNQPRDQDSLNGNCRVCTGPTMQDVIVTFSTITPNGFTIHVRSLGGVNFTAATDITVRGHVLARDWNDWQGVHGDY